MNRIVTLLLCICSAVVCAFVAWLGYQARDDSASVSGETPAYSCQTLLENRPADLEQLRLTDYKSGKHYVSYDDDRDGNWDRVFVALFPAQLTSLTRNYRAVIVSMVGIANEQQLFEKINADNLEADYWSWSQNLDSATYSRMAEHYDSLDFKRSVILYSGYPRRNGTGQYMLWGAAAGLALSLLGIGWQTIGLMAAGLRREAEEDHDEEIIITNRAELPTSVNQ